MRSPSIPPISSRSLVSRLSSISPPNSTPGSKKEDAIRNQYEFFVQRMGGPPLYSQRKGHPALIGRHRPFPVTHLAAERWLQHMQQALDSTPEIDPDSKTKMMNFFRHTAFFLVAGDQLKYQSQQAPTCKHVHSK
ncbi:hypothetical protein SAY86_002362 [Trapa natans]|uniref:Uncharacterized protein n=1 Tax=Trapa natans TaxID=22666 RepID=A0AAN7R4P4_TRANT|nr:hypothetical protein SAY86_002362 [Trapa natans]